MKKIFLALFVISILASCSASKDSSAIEKPEKPATPEVPKPTSVSPSNPNNYPVK